MGAKESRALATKRFLANNPEWKKNYDRKYYRDHKEANRVQSAFYRRRAKEERPHLVMLRASRHRARKIGVEFNITAEDILPIPELCPVLGIELKMGNKGGGLPCSPSIDRIDNSKGYIKGNVRVISNRANKLKNNATIEEMELILEDLKRSK